MKSRNYLDLIIPSPAILSHVDPRKPLCNGGSASAPDEPPPLIAPYRASSDDGTQQAVGQAKSRKGLRKTILEKAKREQASPTLGTSTPATTLGTSTVAGNSPTTLAAMAR